MNYQEYLKNKNLSNETIRVYLININQWFKFIKEKNVDKTEFVNFIKFYSQNHKPNSVHLMYCSIISYFRFMKQFELITECKDVRLPQQHLEHKQTITINEFSNVYDNYFPQSFMKKRN